MAQALLACASSTHPAVGAGSGDDEGSSEDADEDDGDEDDGDEDAGDEDDGDEDDGDGSTSTSTLRGDEDAPPHAEMVSRKKAAFRRIAREAYRAQRSRGYGAALATAEVAEARGEWAPSP